MGRLIFVLLIATSISAQTPIDFKKWHNGGQSYTQTLGGAVANYQKSDQSWDVINNNYQQEGDSVWFVDNSVMKLRVNKNGTTVMMLPFEGQTYTVTSRLRGIAFFNMSTKARQWFDPTMEFSTFSVDSNIFKWEDVSFGGVDYYVKKYNGQIQHTIYFDSTFLDSAVARYNQSSDTANIALVNVVAYTLSANIDNHDSAIGFTNKRLFKELSEKYDFEQSRQRLIYQGSDTITGIPIKQFWKIRDDTLFCFEAVKMSQIKAVHDQFPSTKIWHNATTVISGTTNIEDTELYEGSIALNGFGGRVLLRVDSQWASIHTVVSFLRAKNVSTELPANATITSSVCSIYVYDDRTTVTGLVFAYRMLKPWVEGTDDNVACTDGCEWAEWDCANTKPFTDPGAECDLDGGDNSSETDASCVADSADMRTTAESSKSIDGTNDAVWLTWSLTNALTQGWYDGTINEEGIVLRANSTGNPDLLIRSTEAVADSNFPVFRFTYDIASTGQKVMIKN